jgi:hypothetical protein
MAEIVYVLTNQAMPGYVKIGMTQQNDVEERVRRLDCTSTPLPFEVFYSAIVANAKNVEALLHDAFMDSRVRRNREFFQIDPARVVSALKIGEIQDITPTIEIVSNSSNEEKEDDLHALEKARTKSERLNFEMVNIPVGAELSFVRNEEIKARVISSNKIEYMGNVYSASSLALKILQNYYGWTAKTLNGWPYWLYEGESISARAERIAQKDSI